MLPAQLGGWQTSLLLFDHPDDLRFGETVFLMSSAPSQVGQTLHHGEGTSGGQVNPLRSGNRTCSGFAEESEDEVGRLQCFQEEQFHHDFGSPAAI